MTSADDVLNQIDVALYDVTVSADAMRSRPAAEPAGIQGVTPTVFIADELGEWQELGQAVAFDLQIEGPPVDAEFERAWRDLRRRIASSQRERIRITTAALEQMKRAIKQTAPAVRQAADTFRHLPEAVGCDDCKPVPPRDRAAWQSPYGPARLRR